VFLSEFGAEVFGDPPLNDEDMITPKVVVEWQLNEAVIKQDNVARSDAAGNVFYGGPPGLVFRFPPVV
jgi:hypothetical protein